MICSIDKSPQAQAILQPFNAAHFSEDTAPLGNRNMLILKINQNTLEEELILDAVYAAVQDYYGKYHNQEPRTYLVREACDYACLENLMVKGRHHQKEGFFPMSRAAEQWLQQLKNYCPNLMAVWSARRLIELPYCSSVTLFHIYEEYAVVLTWFQHD
jgi:hypothetical protein